MGNSKVWYITGASQGLGLALVKKLLEGGYRVAATSRNADVASRSSRHAGCKKIPTDVRRFA